MSPRKEIPGYEITDSMQSFFANKKPDIHIPILSDSEILAALEGRNDGIIGYYNQILGLAGEGLLPNDYLPPIRQVEIAKQIAEDTVDYDEWVKKFQGVMP